jgi:hypothetical protein
MILGSRRTPGAVGPCQLRRSGPVPCHGHFVGCVGLPGYFVVTMRGRRTDIILRCPSPARLGATVGGVVGKLTGLGITASPGTGPLVLFEIGRHIQSNNASESRLNGAPASYTVRAQIGPANDAGRIPEFVASPPRSADRNHARHIRGASSYPMPEEAEGLCPICARIGV